MEAMLWYVPLLTQIDEYLYSKKNAMAKWGPDLDEAYRALSSSWLRPRRWPAQDLPAVEWFDQCLDRMPDATAAFAPILRQARPHFHWQRNLNYLEDPTLDAFTSNYAYFQLVGSYGLLPHQSVAMGMILIGPNTLYPSHHHPATEFYFPLSGTAEWQQGGGAFEGVPAGSLIYHAPWQLHATQTRAEPLLALYVWIGDIQVNASIHDGQ